MVCGVGLTLAQPTWAEPVRQDPVGGGGQTDPNQQGGQGGGQTATNPCGGTFLGFKPWYEGLCANNEIVPVCEKDSGCPQNSKKLNVFIWTAVLNVTFDLGLAVGYIAVAMVIYGGYMYMMSQGDPARTAKGKKTLMSAIIGVIIAMAATVIVNTLKLVLNISSDGWSQGTVTNETVQGVFNWAYLAAGIVAVGFIIKGGVDYMMSSGDPGKAHKATQGIIFAVVGLVIVMLAAVITSFIISRIGGAL